jgi:GxxExxY protein
VELKRAGISFSREQKYHVAYKGEILPHHYFADFVIFDRILFEGKACRQLGEAHVKQTLNYLAASKLKLGLLVNFGEDSLTWRRVVLSKSDDKSPPDLHK